MTRTGAILLVVGLALCLVAARWLVPVVPPTYKGPGAVLEPAFALGLLSLVLLLAGAVGQKALRRLGLSSLSQLEQAVFALTLGLGVLAYGVLALGLLGWLHSWAILAWLAAVGLWTWEEWSSLVSHLPAWFARQCRACRNLGWVQVTILSVAGLLLLTSLLNALTPPWDYDGLMYHLPGPQLFLAAGRVLLLPDIWQANGPLTVEMLFTIGLAWGSDVFAKLIHLTYGVCFVLGTFAFGRRFLGRMEAWTAVFLLFGVPILPMLSASAYIDLAWAAYEFLGLYALVQWQEEHERRWLLLGGLMMGWALGSKYLALGGLGTLGLWVLWQERRAGWKEVLASGAILGLSAALVASPWYIKNWLLSGNPIYPFVFGGPGWSSERLKLLMEYLHSFGVGRSLLDYLLLPWNLYARSQEFATLGAVFDLPGLLLPLAVLYPVRPRSRALSSIACISALRFVVWAMGSQQTRFLLPIFPALALLGAGVLVWLARRLRPRVTAIAALAYLIPAAPVLLSLFVQAAMFYAWPPTNVVLGLESRQEFLQTRLVSYATLQFVQDNLSNKDRVLMMWDGRSYYCGARCLPDVVPWNWTSLVDSNSDALGVAAVLHSQGITHLLLNRQDAALFLAQDPAGRQALEFFMGEFRAACAEEVYHDEAMTLVRLTCGSQ